jgi:hypothetical protein
MENTIVGNNNPIYEVIECTIHGCKCVMELTYDNETESYTYVCPVHTGNKVTLECI